MSLRRILQKLNVLLFTEKKKLHISKYQGHEHVLLVNQMRHCFLNMQWAGIILLTFLIGNISPLNVIVQCRNVHSTLQSHYLNINKKIWFGLNWIAIILRRSDLPTQESVFSFLLLLLLLLPFAVLGYNSRSATKWTGLVPFFFQVDLMSPVQVTGQ